MKLNKYLFFILIFLLNLFQSFKYFRAYTLFSKDILLITDEGIIKYISTNKEQIKVKESNLISSENYLDYISFSQLSLVEGGYIFARLNNHIFIFDESLTNVLQDLTVDEILNSFCVLNPYKSKDGNLRLIISYVNGAQHIRIIIYQINLNDGANPGILINEITQDVINYETNTLQKVVAKGIACQFISLNEYENDLLVCFTVESQSFWLVASIFNIEDGLSFLYFSSNSIKTNGTSIIDSVISPNKDKNFICFIDYKAMMNCITYDSKINKFNDLIKLNIKCNVNLYNIYVQYISEEQEYMVYCLDYYDIKFIKFNQDNKIKEIDIDNSKCYILFNILTNYNYNIYSSNLLYFQNDGKYYLMKSINNNNKEEYELLNIPENCNTKIEVEEPNDNIDSTLLSKSSTILMQQPSTTSFLEKIMTSLPLTTIPNIENELTTTAIKINNDSPSTILEVKNELTTTAIEINNDSPTTILEAKNESPTTAIEINNDSPTTILEIKDESPSTSIEEKNELPTTILNIKNDIQTTSMEIKLPSTFLEINNESPTTILDAYVESPSTALEVNNEFLFTSLEIKNKSFSLLPTTTLFKTIIYSSLTISNKPILDYNNQNKSILFYEDGDIMKGKINKTKEELENSLDELMNDIEIGKKYEINGKDYNITITPINDINSFKSSFCKFFKL